MSGPSKHRACVFFLSQRGSTGQSFMRQDIVLGRIRRHKFDLGLVTTVPCLTFIQVPLPSEPQSYL